MAASFRRPRKLNYAPGVADRGYVLESEAGFDVLFDGAAEPPWREAPAADNPATPFDDSAPVSVRACRRRRRNLQQRR